MLKTAVDSVLKQTYRPIEVLVVNDGSTDETGVVAESLAREHPSTVRVLSQPNRGAGPARESGRLQARGEFIQYLDSDDRLLPGKFRAQVEALCRNPDCGIAYGRTRLVSDDGSVLVEPFKWTGQDHQHLFPGLLVDRWWCTHTPLYRRAVCDEIGPWSELRYSQDWQYDARAGALGTRLVRTDVLVSEHFMHTESRQTGHGRWLTPADQLRFFTTLHDCALRAGVALSTPEMRHFSRWVFAQARKCGALGENESAESLFRLAREATLEPDMQMKMVGAIAKVLGWKVVGSLSHLRDRLRNGGAGTRTLGQSWMAGEGP